VLQSEIAPTRGTCWDLRCLSLGEDTLASSRVRTAEPHAYPQFSPPMDSALGKAMAGLRDYNKQWLKRHLRCDGPRRAGGELKEGVTGLTNVRVMCI
jgi:hypothetical protein